MEVIEIKVKAPKVFRVNGEDYRLSFSLAATAELEEKLGRSMKYVSDWLRIQTKEVRDILAAGFYIFHPNEAERVADAIAAELDPEEIEHVIDGLCVAAFPKAMARLHEEMQKAQERIQKGLSALPNGQGASVS